MDDRIIHLDNEYTKHKHQKLKQAKTPKRKHLGVILVVAILLFSLASVSLVQAYNNLEKQLLLEKQAAEKEKQLSKDLEVKSQEIQKLKDPDYLKKYARAKGYSEQNEKTFTTPDPNTSGN